MGSFPETYNDPQWINLQYPATPSVLSKPKLSVILESGSYLASQADHLQVGELASAVVGCVPVANLVLECYAQPLAPR